MFSTENGWSFDLYICFCMFLLFFQQPLGEFLVDQLKASFVCRMLLCDGYPLQQHNPGNDSGVRHWVWKVREEGWAARSMIKRCGIASCGTRKIQFDK